MGKASSRPKQDAAGERKTAAEAPAKVMSRQEQRQRVLELMTLGRMTVPQAARAVGLQPPTVRGWLKNDPAFKRELDAWRAGPAMDAVTLAQSRRIIVDELCRRMLHEREGQSIRDLISVHDRIIRETANVRENDYAGDIDGEPLTPEQHERLLEEIDREAHEGQGDQASVA